MWACSGAHLAHHRPGPRPRVLVRAPFDQWEHALEPERGFEPLTCRLQIGCAAIAPPGPVSPTGLREPDAGRCVVPPGAICAGQYMCQTQIRPATLAGHARHSIGSVILASQGIGGVPQPRMEPVLGHALALRGRHRRHRAGCNTAGTRAGVRWHYGGHTWMRETSFERQAITRCRR